MSRFHSGDCASVLLRDVPHPEKYFYFKDGTIAKNLKDLSKIVKTLPEDIFQEHVSEGINDFSLWIRDVIGDVRLSRHIEKTTDRNEMAKLLDSRVAWLEKRARYL
jgi:hypothetical protein